jgi:hypothetical protein
VAEHIRDPTVAEVIKGGLDWLEDWLVMLLKVGSCLRPACS